MSTANLTALIAALTALIGAVAGLVGVVRHVTGPAHQDTPAPPAERGGYSAGGRTVSDLPAPPPSVTTLEAPPAPPQT